MIRKSIRACLYLIATFLILFQSAYALNIVELSPGYYPNSSKGKPLSSADIYVGKPDLDPEIVANQKTLSVQQEDGTIVAVSQPIHTSAGGVPQYAGSPVTLLVEGDYSLKVLDSHGSQIYYIPSTAYEKYLVTGNYYYPDYAEADQGVVGGGNTVTDILAEVGAVTKATMYFSHNSGAATTTYTFTTNTTITDNFNIIREDGVILDGAGQLTINGPFPTGRYQVFGASITIAFGDGSVKEAHPEWWGENTTPGTTDMTTEIQAAMDCGVDKVSFASTTYLTGTLTPPTQITLQGVNQAQTTLKLAAGTDGHLLDCNTCVWLNVLDLTLNGNSANNAATSNGVDMATCVSCTFERVRIKDFNDYGVYLNTCNDIVFHRSWITENAYGFYATSSEQCNLEKCVIEKNTTYGVQYVSALVGAVSTVNGCWFENQGETPTDYIIIDSDYLCISNNKFNVTGCSNSAVRVKTGSYHNYILNNAFHNTGPTYYIVFDSGAKYNTSHANWGGSAGIVGGSTTDNDGGNYITEYDNTNGAFMGQAGRVYNNVIAFDADDTTPSVKNGNYFVTSPNTVATAITMFDDGENGQIIYVRGGSDANSSTLSSAETYFRLSANMTLTIGDCIVLQMRSGHWEEISRTTWDGN